MGFISFFKSLFGKGDETQFISGKEIQSIPSKQQQNSVNNSSDAPMIIDEELLEQLHYKWESAGEIIHELVNQAVYKDKNHLKFLQYLVNLVDQEKIELPVLPDIASRIIKLSFNSDATFTDYVDLVKSDQVIALKLIEVANTPYFRSRSKIQDLNMAITRIGIKGLKELVMMISMRGTIFNHKFYKKEVELIWRNTLFTAMLASKAASQCGIDASIAYTAGLIHDIGQIVIYNAVNGFRKFHNTDEWPDPYFVQRTAMSFHQKLSAFTLNKWDLDDSLIDTIRTHHTPPDDDGPPMAKLLYFSFQTAALIRYYDYPSEFDFLPDFIMVQAKRIGLSAMKTKSIIMEATAQFKELSDMI